MVYLTCGRTLILLRAASRWGESTGLWVETQSWQRLSPPVSESTHTHPLCMVVCQLLRVGSGEHYFLIKYVEENSASLGCIRLFYSTNWANYTTIPQARTQKTKQHTTTNMSCRCPTHQQLRFSLSMATSAMYLDLGTAAPYGSEAGVGRSVCSCHCRFCQLERWNRAHKKNKEICQALAIGGRRLGTLNNNQPDSRWKQ